MNILLIEDNMGDARLIQIMLRDTMYDYQIKHVVTLKEGIDHAQTGDYDVVLTDLSLPDSQKLEAVQRLNDETETPFIVLTGTNDADAGLEAVKAGAQDYLVKGEVDSNLLQRSINYAIQRHRAEKQAQELATVQERQRLARDLHDSVTQMLFSASVMAETALRQWTNNHERSHEMVSDIHVLTRGALAEMRVLLLELRPRAFDQVDFEKLVSQLALANGARNGWMTDIDVQAVNHVIGDHKVLLYRIVQEALNNISKHADAHHIWIEARDENNFYTLSIRDDGVGFQKAEIDNASLGLGIMQERANVIQAIIEINSSPGEGTEVVLRWENQDDN